MKNIKKLIIIPLFLMIILTLFACGVNTKNQKFAYTVAETAAVNYGMGTNGFARTTSASMKMKDLASPDVYYDMEEEAVADDSGINTTDRKIIKNVDISTETKEFDASILWLKEYVKSYNGVIDNSYVDSGNMANPNYMKNANFSIRIPAEKLDAFLSNLGNRLNITYQHENIRDVTDTYDDTQQRQYTLTLEEAKLNELLVKAKDINDIIQIENKLSEVRYELANITKRLKKLDKQIDYSTVNISINEVRDLSTIVRKNDYSRENIIKLINKNFEDTKQAIIDFVIKVVTHLPAICLALIIIIILLIIIAIFKSVFGSKIKSEKASSKTTKTKKGRTKKSAVKEEVKLEESEILESLQSNENLKSQDVTKEKSINEVIKDGEKIVEKIGEAIDEGKNIVAKIDDTIDKAKE